jgi:hypothetical protein
MHIIRTAISALAIGLVATLAPAAAVQASGPAAPAATAYTVSLKAPSRSMTYTEATFSFTASPAAKAAGLRVGLQVRSNSLGWYTTKRATLDANGTATIALTRKSTGKVDYRAALYSPGGRVLAYSKRTTVTWTALKYAVSLRCDKSASEIRVDVPCTITVTPAVRRTGLVARFRVMGMNSWVYFDSFKLPASGVINTDVEGYQPGVGKYQVVLVRSGKVLAESNTFSIAYSADHSGTTGAPSFAAERSAASSIATTRRDCSAVTVIGMPLRSRSAN